jgi:hypothetical protein
MEPQINSSLKLEASVTSGENNKHNFSLSGVTMFSNVRPGSDPGQKAAAPEFEVFPDYYKSRELKTIFTFVAPELFRSRFLSFSLE